MPQIFQDGQAMSIQIIDQESFMECPECDRPAIPAAYYTVAGVRVHGSIKGAEPMWENDQTTECICGASLSINADGERAWVEVT